MSKVESDVLGIIANLSRRVNRLERDLYTAQNNIETWAQEVEKVRGELDDKIEMCIDDIVTLDERTSERTNERITRRCCCCR